MENVLQIPLALWNSLGPAGPYYVWLLCGFVGASLWLWLVYWLVRKYVLLQVKVNGAWIRPEHLNELLDRMQQRERDGVILDLKDAQLLDRYRPDRRIALKTMGDKEYASW